MSIRVNVDPANPGQFFACCGLLELADRLWGEAEGAFSASGAEFCVTPKRNSNVGDPGEFLDGLASCAINSTMTDDQIAALKKLLNRKKTSLTLSESAEKERLSEMWKRERLYWGHPFNLWIDWWGDDHAGGSRFKTWAGKQFVLDLARGMQAQISSSMWSSTPPEEWLSRTSSAEVLPLYFDSDIGDQSSALDAGFSIDPLGMYSSTKPVTELAALVGLQRFRPFVGLPGDTFGYVQWTESLPPILAALACCGCLPAETAVRTFEFSLLYRTKYLKSFLSAKLKGG